MEDLTHPSCDLCRATTPRDLVRFHKLWHESQTGRSTQFFGEQDLDPAVAQLLQAVAAFRAVPPVTPRTEFVRDLRERLMAETPYRTSALSAATRDSEGE